MSRYFCCATTQVQNARMERFIVTGDLFGDQLIETEVHGDCVRISDQTFHIKATEDAGIWLCAGDRHVMPAYVECDATGTVRITIGGYPYVVKCYPARYGTMLGIIANAQQRQHSSIHVRAPMPGLIKAVNIAEGASVRRGESIIVLEAMKMENLLRAPMTGVVRSLAVVSGQTVEKGDLLCTIELDGQLERQSDG